MSSACPYCERTMVDGHPWFHPTKNHVVPRSKGGTVTVTACVTCNQDKADMELAEFYAALRRMGDERADIIERTIRQACEAHPDLLDEFYAVAQASTPRIIHRRAPAKDAPKVPTVSVSKTSKTLLSVMGILNGMGVPATKWIFLPPRSVRIDNSVSSQVITYDCPTRFAAAVKSVIGERIEG